MDESAIERFQMSGQDIGWLLRHWADRKPDHPALVWDPPAGSSRTWTYAELLDDTRSIAAGLAGQGVTQGDRVLIHTDNCPEMLLSWLACALVGAVGVTTNTRSAPDEVAWFVEQSRCRAAITSADYADQIAAAGDSLEWVATIGLGLARADAIGFDDLRVDPGGLADLEPDPLAPFCIMFTSGTTSKPKAVVHTHGNAVWASRSGPRTIDLGTDDCYLIYLPLFHVNAQSWSYLSVLGVGATAVLMPKWSSSRFWEVVARHDVTHISLLPFAFSTLAAPDRPQTKLRAGVYGLMQPGLADQSGIAIYSSFGMTETVTHAISGKPQERLPDSTMGHPTPGYEIAVVDQETGDLCPPGRTGELWIRGTRGIQLFLEYDNNPEANSAAFQDGWFKTGDMVVVGVGGNVFYRERDKDLLKVGGENVSAVEVERVIGALPEVLAAAVVARRDDFLDEVPVAFVIAAPGGPDDQALEHLVIEACRGKLADFKVPRAVHVVTEFPMGTLDKILKNQLRELANQDPSA